MRGRIITDVVSITLLGLITPLMRAPVTLGQPHDDVFHASDILPREAIEGANYRIADTASIEAYQYVFTVDSDFGQFTAKG
ncbi:MAG: hypothetical protein JSW27_01420, partial [Phycisphaerales bacterium]